MPSQGLASVQPARVEALRARHAALAEKIEQEQSRLSTKEWYIRDLKRQKLRIKEEIEGVRRIVGEAN